MALHYRLKRDGRFDVYQPGAAAFICRSPVGRAIMVTFVARTPVVEEAGKALVPSP